MIWTNNKPTKPGWYWWRRTNGKHWTERVAAKYRVVAHGGTLWMLGFHKIPLSHDWLDYGEWAGPIPLPEEPS